MSPCWSDDHIAAAARSGASDDPHFAECARCDERLADAGRELALLAELSAVRSPALRTSEPAPEPGQIAPGYRIGYEIHRGGQGIVYRAVQEATRRPVALKVLLRGSEATGRELQRFEREIELASRLDHPGIVTLYDSGISRATPWYAMELVDGVRLDEWARTVRPSARESVGIVRKIAAAVAHAHHRGVIHRDIKPANVLVDERGEPHVLDFGAAFAGGDARHRPRMTAPGEFLGTLAYAAPEQLRGGSDPVDTRTDVYALGVVLYELLAGRLPFAGGVGLAEVVERATHETPDPPSRHAAGSRHAAAIDRDLDAVVLRALSTEPADRYGTAEALERDLGHWLAGEPVDARRHSAGYLLRKHLARRKKALAAAALLALAGGTVAFAWWREHRRAETQVEQAALVRSIIQDLIAQAAPQRMGGDARVLDVYEVLARDLDAALGSAPDIQAEVELTIGDTYRRLRRSAEAEPHLRKALERFREIDDRRGLQVARAGSALALALADVNRPEAIDAATEALAIRERELAASDPRVAESRRTLAIALLAQFQEGEPQRARALLDRALDDLRALYGDDHPEVAETKLLRAQAGDDLRPAEIDALLSSALETLERTTTNDPRALDALTARASFLQAHGRFAEARDLLERAGVLAQRLFGDALGADMLRRQARLEFARGEMANAEMLSRQAIARELERWAGKRAEIAEPLRALARRVQQPGPPAAEPPYSEAFAELRALEGDGAFELAGWMNGVALVLRALGRGTAAEPVLREALNIRCRAMGADCPIRRRTIELLSSELADQRRFDEAVPLLEESVATYERIHEDGTPEAARARELLAACQAHAGDEESTDGEAR